MPAGKLSMTDLGYGTIVRRVSGEQYMLIRPSSGTSDSGWWTALTLDPSWSPGEDGKVVPVYLGRSTSENGLYEIVADD